MSGPFEDGIGAEEMALILAISEENEVMAEERRLRLLEEHDQDEADDLDDECLPNLDRLT